MTSMNAAWCHANEHAQRDLGRISPRISAVVPAYNVERYIDAALASLIHQTKNFCEIIVVDDGSTDITRQKLKSYEDNGQIVVVEQANAGQGPARNTGLFRATGDYVYFFDSDDLLDRNFVERISAIVESDNSVELIFFAGQSFLDEGFSSHFFPDYRRQIAGCFASGIDAAKALWCADSFLASPCLFVARKSVWDRNQLLFSPVLHEDEDMILRLCAAAGKTVVIKDLLFKRRIRESSIMTSGKSFRHAEGIFYAFQSTAKLCREYLALSTNHRGFAKERLGSLCRDYLDVCDDVRALPRYWSLLRAYQALAWRPPLRVVAGAFGIKRSKVSMWMYRLICKHVFPQRYASLMRSSYPKI